MVSFRTLSFISSVGALAVAGMSTLYYFQLQNQIRNSVLYKDAMNVVYSTEKIVKYLGEPIKEGKAVMGHYSDNLDWLSIGLNGSKTSGRLYCDFEREHSLLRRIAIEFTDKPGVQVVIREYSDESKK